MARVGARTTVASHTPLGGERSDPPPAPDGRPGSPSPASVDFAGSMFRRAPDFRPRATAARPGVSPGEDFRATNRPHRGIVRYSAPFRPHCVNASYRVRAERLGPPFVGSRAPRCRGISPVLACSFGSALAGMDSARGIRIRRPGFRRRGESARSFGPVSCLRLSAPRPGRRAWCRHRSLPPKGCRTVIHRAGMDARPPHFRSLPMTAPPATW